MARTPDPDSATAQFFINVADNSENLDRTSDTNPKEAGYCVFGKVIEGMDVVDAVKQGDKIERVRIEGDADAVLAAKADRVAEWNKILAA